ncbi:DUF3108 domain-containing protein [Thalassotalea ponticola]|uniref:DUF3108 domain-containing protein n=1 Tax=Thalassotalea ponticola TaxID=1523392 RepID=UPI0025B2A5A6|nr:DUF3108 domain-containing protein [Thalassotalea ponticola]MDN3653018.1 DUF3108 domain-containing protein [Thalassotalea ponticola]
MGSKLLSLILIALSSVVPSATAEPAVNTDKVSQLPNFTAQYHIYHDDNTVGKATRTLKNLADNTVEFSYQTDIEWLIFSDHRREVTTNKIIDGQVIPITYHSTRKGTGKDKRYSWSFNRQKSQVTDLKKQKTIDIDWPQGLQSKLSYHLQSRLNLLNGIKHFDFATLTTSGNVKNYTYEYMGEEQISVPYGEVKAIKLKREKSNKQTTYVWFAPELGNLMVKLHQIDGSLKEFEVKLVSVKTENATTEKTPLGE